MLLKCIAIDDEPLALQLIKEYVSRFASLQLVQVFEDTTSGAEFLKKHPVDLLFVDINMPGINEDLVRSLEQRPIIIFTTAHKNFSFEIFELEVLDYLLKPIDFKQFGQAVEKARAYHEYKSLPATANQPQSLYLYSEYRMIKIELPDIEYIESIDSGIKLHLISQPKPLLILMPLKEMLEKLPETHFKRIHHSYLVAINHVRCIQNHKVRLTTVELPMGDTYSHFLTEWKSKL